MSSAETNVHVPYDNEPTVSHTKKSRGLKVGGAVFALTFLGLATTYEITTTIENNKLDVAHAATKNAELARVKQALSLSGRFALINTTSPDLKITMTRNGHFEAQDLARGASCYTFSVGNSGSGIAADEKLSAAPYLLPQLTVGTTYVDPATGDTRNAHMNKITEHLYTAGEMASFVHTTQIAGFTCPTAPSHSAKS